MGLFDRVYFDCPCHGKIEAQSKVYDDYTTYPQEKVPTAIAIDLATEEDQFWQCDKCGNFFKPYIDGPMPPATVPMKVRQAKPEELNEHNHYDRFKRKQHETDKAK